jgi:hypothetical protein
MTEYNLGISVYSMNKAEWIAEQLKKYSPLFIQDCTGEDVGFWPIYPSFEVYLTVLKDDKNAIPEILGVTKQLNASVWTEEDMLQTPTFPSTIEEHRVWCEMSPNQHQYTFYQRKIHPDSEKLCCNLCPNCEWYSLPEGVEGARRECPYCLFTKLHGEIEL